MKTFLGVPIVLRGVAYGNLYLTEKAGGADFTTEDEELTQLLAAQAAVAIENARLYESSTRWLRAARDAQRDRQRARLRGRARAPACRSSPGARSELVEARIVLIALPDAGGWLGVAAAAGAGADDLLGTRLELGSTKVGRVLERGQSERVDAVLDDPEVDQRVARGSASPPRSTCR